jgi:hypothetical protein
LLASEEKHKETTPSARWPCPINLTFSRYGL